MNEMPGVGGKAADAGESLRARASDIIRAWQEEGVFPDHLIEDVKTGRPFLTEVVYGTVKMLRTLDWFISKCASRKPDSRARACILAGIYQLAFMDSQPSYAVVNDSVEAMRPSGAGAQGFVNAVLREFLRRKDDLLHELEGESCGLRNSHPDWLVKRWQKAFGDAEAEALCEWNNTRPNVVIRPFVSRVAGDVFIRKLRDAGVGFSIPRVMPDEFICIERGTPVEDIPGYEEGLFTVQDMSTALAVHLLDPGRGETILDACASPGGKTVMIYDRTGGKADITAVDNHQGRLDILRDTITRIGCSRVTVRLADSASDNLLAFAPGGFDRILLDVPCSNTGVLRRRADARWRISRDEIAAMTLLQARFLDNAAAALRRGGVIVYSTCSLETEECSGLVSGWLGHNSGFALEKEVSLRPPRSCTDGAYAARIRKN